MMNNILRITFNLIFQSLTFLLLVCYPNKAEKKSKDLILGSWLISNLQSVNNSSVTCTESPCLRFIIQIDPTKPRLDNFGNPSVLATGHSAQNPDFKLFGAHYFELVPDKTVQLGAGRRLYSSPETDAGGSKAVDFELLKRVQPGQEAFSISLKNIAPGTFEYLRISAAFQEYNVSYQLDNSSIQSGRLASFVAYNSFIKTFIFDGNLSSINVNSNQRQGYWGFFTKVSSVPITVSGLAPQASTTVPNPIEQFSPIPRSQNSCVVTGIFKSPLIIKGTEKEDITVTVTFSSNNSFEWSDTDGDSLWDISSTGSTEPVVDMGVRGMTINVQ